MNQIHLAKNGTFRAGRRPLHFLTILQGRASQSTGFRGCLRRTQGMHAGHLRTSDGRRDKPFGVT